MASVALGRSLTFWEHTIELIRRVRNAVYALVASSLATMLVPINIDSISLSLTQPVYETLTTYLIKRLQIDLLPPSVELLPMDWFAPFTVYIAVSIFLGAVVSSPVTIYEIYRFIGPALRRNERRYILLFTASFSLLFLTGVLFGYLIVVPISFRMLLASTLYLGLVPRYEFTSFFSIILGGLAMTGLMFTFPVFFVTLVRAGIVKTSLVTKARRYLYAGVFILIAVTTPDPTIVSDVIIFLPVLLLTEASIVVGKRIEKKRQNQKIVPNL